jgi:hypothetical protein
VAAGCAEGWLATAGGSCRAGGFVAAGCSGVAGAGSGAAGGALTLTSSTGAITRGGGAGIAKGGPSGTVAAPALLAQAVDDKTNAKFRMQNADTARAPGLRRCNV